MELNQYEHWRTTIQSSSKAAYKLVAELIEQDIDRGALQAGDRLPPIRQLAVYLGINYTTLTRGYKEAAEQGLIQSQAGSGSYVKGKAPQLPLRGGSNAEMTMNLPPEPNNPALIDKIRQSMASITSSIDVYEHLRYQDFGGSPEDKDAARRFLKPLIGDTDPEQLLICPGIHAALTALVSHLGKQGDTIATPNLVYPGLKAIASQLGFRLTAFESDHEGPIIRSLEALCKTTKVSAIYLNPTLQNPSTVSISQARKEAIADIALHYSINIIEDDPYAMLLDEPPTAIATLAPDVTYYISGLSKCFGAGLRSGFLKSPNKLLCQRTAGALRALNVMSPPITNTLVTEWINNRIVCEMIDAVKAENLYRMDIVRHYLRGYAFDYHPQGFHIWLPVNNKDGIGAVAMAHYLRNQGVNAVASQAFCVDNTPPEAIRLCLGGSMSRIACIESVKLVKDTLEHPEHLASAIL